MGQYYIAATYDKNNEKLSFFNPVDYDNGSKLLEHSYFGNWLTTAVLLDVLNEPRVVSWIGDYTEEGDPAWHLYPLAWGWDDDEADKPAVRHFNKVNRSTNTDEVVDFLKDNDTTKGYLVNIDELEYVDIEKYYRIASKKNGGDDLVIHPLPLLTATSCGRGGGDYHEGMLNYDRVGTWAETEISYQFVKPENEDYTDITEECIFIET